MAEARIVAVLLTDVVSSTQHLTQLGDEAGNAQRVRHFELLRSCLGHHDGQEVKNTGDGLLAVFPSAVDAVRCATAMQRAVTADRRENPDDGVEMKIGLHLGEPVQDVDDFFGAPMVLVTRLCAAAQPGQIVASELLRTLVASKHELLFEPLGALQLKGLDHPVPAWSVPWVPETCAGSAGRFLAPLAAPAARTCFVDRVEERARVGSWYGHALEGHRTLGLVAGEPGVGKTRLVAQFANEAHEQGATVLWGRCFEESFVAHAPFVEALRALFEWACEHPGTLDGVEAAAQHLCELAPSFSPPCRSTGAEAIVSPGAAAALRRAEVDQGAERLRLFDAVDRVLGELCAVGPVVLVLDDLQWADEATLLLLSHLVRSPDADRLLVLGTYRDTEVARSVPLARTLADLRRERREQRLLLRGLDGAAVHELVDRLSGGSLDDEVVRAVGDRTDGNPFFIEEVVSHLLETDSATDPSLPEGVREVIGRRLARLSSSVNEALTVAAVLGREFSMDVVEALVGTGRDALVDQLDAALHAGLVAEVGERPGRFGFTHGLVRESLLAELSGTRRARLHQRIAEHLEHSVALGEGEVNGRTAELAHHALAAVPLFDTGRAVEHAVDAGDHALSDLDYERAAQLFDTADAVLVEASVAVAGASTDRRLRARVRLGAGTAHVLAGHGPAARAAFRACIDDASELHDPELQARATLGLGSALGSGVGFEFGVFSQELVDLIEAALAALGQGDSELRARLTARLGSAHGFSPDPARGIDLCRRAVAMAERLGDPVTLAACCNDLRAAGWNRVDPVEQRRLGDRIVELAATAHEPLIELQGRVWQVCDALERGTDASEVDRSVVAMAELVDRLRLPQYRWYLELYAANRALLDGDVERAEHHSARALEVGSPMGEVNVELAFGAATYLQHLERGNVAELAHFAAEQATRFPAMPAWRAVHAQSVAAAGALVEARALAGRTLAVLRSVAVDPLRPITLALLVDVADRLDDAELAAELVELLEPDDGRRATVAQMVGCWGAVSHHLGVACSVAGDLDRASDRLASAVTEHEALRAPTWTARSRAALENVERRRAARVEVAAVG